MDKELIERLRVMADEIESRGCPGWADAMRESADELARIDAERGKMAVAWALFSENINIRIWTSVPEEVRRLAEDHGMTLSPLYLSPTIPEGMALVPVQITKEIEQAFEQCRYCHLDYAESYWDAMLAAAQGERNAAD